MVKIDPELLDEIGKLEVEALVEGLKDPELRRNPSFLEKVRKFLSQNNFKTTNETEGVEELKRHQQLEPLPVFDNEVNVN